MSPRYAEPVLHVLHESWTLLEEKSYPRQVIETMDRFYTKERLERLLSNPERRALGAWRGTRLVGCLWGYRSPIDGTFSIDWVIVRPAVVGSGVFSRLMQTMEAQMRRDHVLKISFYVSAKNILAIKRYVKLGYSIEGVHRNHFFGWNFVSMGNILVRKRWRGKIAKQPDFTERFGDTRG